MANNLHKSYGKGIGLIESAYQRHGSGLDFDRTVSEMLHAAERSRVPHDMATAEGAAHAVAHLKSEGVVKTNPRTATPKSLEAERRSRAVLIRAHQILAENNCSFKNAMVTAWKELAEGKLQPVDPRPKTKKNTGGMGTRGMDHLWRQAMDGNDWAEYLQARAGKAYNTPNMYANGRMPSVRRNVNSPTRGHDALWLQAWDGQPWAMHEMARTGRAYNVPNMWAGQGGNDELQISATKSNPGLKKGQSLMKAAAKRYHAGEFDTMPEAVSAVAAERRGER
jgi:hypothetical protein